MRVCPRCQATYSADERFCPMDGGELALRGPQAAVPASDPRLGRIVAGQFELVEVCGRGAMGTVYRAWQLGMERQVAIKLLRKELVAEADVVKRFHREARVIARLAHPNIVTCHLVGETEDGLPFLVMEYVEGEVLAQVLQRGALEPARALGIARQISSALADAHAHGIVHRDLKPANILVTQRRRAADFVKVLDFGIAKLVGGDGVTDEGEGEAGKKKRLTKTGSVFGTPHYLSPEQAAGGDVDHRADLYSLGVMLFKMTTGRLPFEGSGLAVLLAHAQDAPPSPRRFVPEMDARLEGLILRAMAKDPAQRFQSAEEMSDAIDAALTARGENTRVWARSRRMAAVPEPVVTVPVSQVAPVVEDELVASRPRWVVPAVLLGAAGAGALLVGVAWPVRGPGQAPAPPVAVAAAKPVEAAPAREELPPPPPVAADTKVETLGERGYAVRATVPAAPQVGVGYTLIFDVLAPDGTPLAGEALTAILEEPDGVRREVDARAEAGRPGRFALPRRFDGPGRHFVHIYPDPEDAAAHIWIDLLVGDTIGRVPPAEAVRGELHAAQGPRDKQIAMPDPPKPKPSARRSRPKAEVSAPVAEPVPAAAPKPRPRPDEPELE